MKEMLIQYGAPLSEAWKEGWSGELKRSVLAFVILMGLTWCACMAVPALRTFLVDYVMGIFAQMDVTDGAGNLSASALFLSNIQAVVLTMLYGLIPFVPMTALSLGMNAMLLGVLGAAFLAEGRSLLLFAAGLLPHGIFEFPALILAFSMGLFLCGQVTRRCRHDGTALPVSACISLAARLLLLVLAPLLALAAVMEAWVTPLFISLFI